MHSILFESDASPGNYLDNVADLEAKLKFDTVTYQHSLNVANLAIQLSKQTVYELDEFLVYYSGLFHDIGKSITPLSVLGKEKPLNFDEFSQIKEHAKLGFRILQEYKFPSEILFAALLHHEKYDGNGYPIGFKGKEIPLIARIISICDVFDALTSNRPYRKEYTLIEALKIMKDSKEQFDPELLDLFFTKYEEKKIIKFVV